MSELKKLFTADVVSNDAVDGIFSMWLEAPELDGLNLRPGQFVNVYTDSPAHLLPRPISICQWQGKKLRLVYHVAGEGTEIFSRLAPGAAVKILAPLGNGYEIPKAEGYALVGGGIGIPPLIGLAEEIRRQNPGGKIFAFLGGRTMGFLKYLGADFEKLGAAVAYATDDGSLGFHGNAVELLKNKNPNAPVFCCGPKPMLKAAAELAEAQGLKAWVSTEERMACGIGACVGCVIKIKDGDGWAYKKVCKDGPVFDSGEVCWDA